MWPGSLSRLQSLAGRGLARAARADRAHVDLPEDIITKIDAALRSQLGRLKFSEYPPPPQNAAMTDPGGAMTP
jgi:hypothetical protein